MRARTRAPRACRNRAPARATAIVEPGRRASRVSASSNRHTRAVGPRDPGSRTSTISPPARTPPSAAPSIAASPTSTRASAGSPVTSTARSRSRPSRRCRRCARSIGRPDVGVGGAGPVRHRRTSASTSPAAAGCSSTRARCPRAVARASTRAASASRAAGSGTIGTCLTSPRVLFPPARERRGARTTSAASRATAAAPPPGRRAIARYVPEFCRVPAATASALRHGSHVRARRRPAWHDCNTRSLGEKSQRPHGLVAHSKSARQVSRHARGTGPQRRTPRWGIMFPAPRRDLRPVRAAHSSTNLRRSAPAAGADL